MNKMITLRDDSKCTRYYSSPTTKLRNVPCTYCKHQFFLQEFVPMRGLVPLLLECGHVMCDKCAKLSIREPCPLCNTVPQLDDDQKLSLPLNMYVLGLMVISHNRSVQMDDSDISFSKSISSKSKAKQSLRDLCHECGIQASIKCQQCNALFCILCYSKIHGKALQSHTKIMLTDNSNDNCFSVQNTCSEECTEPLGYYCEDCEVAGCSHCLLHLHKKHNYKTLLEKNKVLLPKFFDVSKCVTENLQRIRQAQKKLSRIAIYPKEAHNIDSVETAVTQHFAHLHGILQNLEKKIIDSLNDHRNARSNNLEDISEQLRDYENQLQYALLITGSVTENIDKIDIHEVIQQLEKLVSTPCHLMLNSIPDDQDITFNFDKSIVDAIEKHYTLDIPATSTFALRRRNSLPDDYKLEPLTEDLNISILKRPSSMVKKTAPLTIPMAPKKCDKLPAVGSSEMIRVTHVVNPSCFYIQMIQNQNRIADLDKELSVLVNTIGVIPTEITINALYIVQCLEDKTWHRARIIDKKDSNDDEKYSVFFVDYGMKEDNVPLSKIRSIVAQFSMLPMMAIRCSLHNIVPNNGKWHPDAIEAFKKLVYSNAMVSMSVGAITGDTYHVELTVISSKDWHLTSVNDSLTYMKYATCVSSDKLMRTNPESTRTYFKEQLDMEIFTDIEVLYVESPHCIYVRKAHGNRSYFRKLISEMTENYGQTLSCNDFIPTLSKDLPCAARGEDSMWHRGIIKEVTENTIRVFYVDLGYTSILSYDAVRALSKKYMSCKTQAIKISLKHAKPRPDDKNEWKEDTNDFLKRYLMRITNLKIVALDKSEDTYNVVMYTHDKTNVCNVLAGKNLALHIYSPYNKFNNNKKKKNKVRKDGNRTLERPERFMEKSIEAPIEIPEKSNNTPNTITKNKGTEEIEDPFKVSVQIHQVQSPDCIYVSNTTQDQVDVEKMMSTMQEFYRKYRSAKREAWTKNAVCAVYLSKNETYYRGRVIDVKSADKVVVFLYDIGTEETVSTGDLQSLYPIFFETPTHVFKVKLSGILPCGGSSFWPSLSTEKLQEIVNNNHNCKFYISKVEDEDVQDSAIPVELWIKQVKMDGPLAPTRYEINSINRMLVENGVALPIKEYAKKRDKILAIELKRMLKKKLERLAKCEPNVKWFEIGNNFDDSVGINMNRIMSKVLNNSDSDSDSSDSNIELYDKIPSLSKLTDWLPAEPIFEDSFIALPTYLDSEGFLYLHPKGKNAEMLQRIERKLEKLYAKCQFEPRDTVWVVGDLCIAQYHSNKKWYRGKVVKVLDNDIVQVMFVDYGNVEECAIGTVKKRVILEDIPIQCTKCAIYGLNPARPSGKWLTDELDRIHSVIIDTECKVTVLDRTKTHLVISLIVLPNKRMKKETDLLTFLINEWEMDLKPNLEISTCDQSVGRSDSPDAIIIENSNSFSLDSDLFKETIISGNSMLPNTIMVDKNDSPSTTDIENLSWSKLKKETISSTPQLASEENLSMNYKPIDIPEDIDFIEIELSFSISTTEFYAHLQKNAHSEVLNNYYKQYELLMKDLQENACKQQPITSFAPNTPCIAKYNDDMWYRSLIIESEPNKDSDATDIKLLYIDYGNWEHTTVNSEQRELFALKKEWIQVPIMAVKCKLWNIEVDPSVDIEDFLTQFEKMYNKNVIAAVKKIGEEFVHIELYDNEEREELLYHTLIENGLFQLTSQENEEN
ncbi:tudor domain-containing protein 1 isoform X1 [Osmia bicornis bicornis]|uniref:tudor domain-containing protein 1 isoform X1 n=2 Tax=Osmia bicornis bicornis TaxID=1437191 RepID=UPI001EAEA444|nr:tudor domain-containing protein 1 isoform X1 [Osmia bicornis bicornis]